MITVTASRNTRRRSRPKGYIADYKPKPDTIALLTDVKAMLNEYRAHWPLTARQIYYRLIGAHGYPKTDLFYERLCNHLSNARRGKVISFDSIRDDGVAVMDAGHFASHDAFYAYIRALGENYERDKLAGQAVYLEVWCEAAGMQPQLAEVAHRYSVAVYSCSGFDSTTAKKDIAARICVTGKAAVILHLGDYDPSGVSIFEAAAEDVAAFVEADKRDGYVSVEFKRVALTERQVQDHALPTAPAKQTDSRAKRWIGETCQLEALPPNQIAELLEEAILDQLDTAQLHQDRLQERVERRQITTYLIAPPTT